MNAALSGIIRLKRRKLAHSRYNAGKMVIRSRTPTAGVTSAQPSPLDSSRVVFMTSFKFTFKRFAQYSQSGVRRHPASAADGVAPRVLADGVPRLLQEPLHLIRC